MRRLGVRGASAWSHIRSSAEGTYNFVCQVHRDTMRGTVTVGRPRP